MERRSAPPPSSTRRRILVLAGAGLATAAFGRLIAAAPGSGSSAGLRIDPRGPSTRSATSGAQAVVELPEPLPETEIPVLDPDLPPPGPDHRFDLVVSGGRVMDPATGFDGLVNVGVDAHRITAISPEALVGDQLIDATGLVVAPGFIDLMSYEPNPFGAWLKVADGVTTNLAMHGVSNYPDPFFDRYEGRSPVHFGGAFHHHFMRGHDLGVGIHEATTGADLDRLVDLARRSLDHGFAGIAFSPEYSPGTSTEEIERLSALAAEIDHVGFHHLRYSDPDPPGTSLEALAEALSVASATGVSTHIDHITSTGGTFVMVDAIEAIEASRSAGLDVTACLYPYDFWGTFLASARFEDGWEQRYRIEVDDLQVAGTDERLTAETWEQARSRNLLVVALDSIPYDEIALALAQPWVLVASDAILTEGSNNHPRGAGTFARTLGEYVRHTGLLDLRTGLAKITILPALRTERMLPAMALKGRLQVGADADITLFDPVTVADRATVADPALPSTGIEWVIVDGRVALRQGRPDRHVLAGRALRSRPLS